MIFQALYEYAERENIGDPDFEDVEIKWGIRLSASGKFIGLESLVGNREGRGKIISCPFTNPAELNSGGKTHFLFDAIRKIAVWSEKKWENDGKAKMKKCQKYFIKLIRDAEKTGSQTEIGIIADFLENTDELDKLKAQLEENGAKGSDKATFLIGKESKTVLESEKVKAYWRQTRKVIPEEKPYKCLITGEVTEGCETTGKIMRLPGGISTGSPLISYDKDAFESYGLEKSFNAAISPKAESKVRAGFQRLLDDGKYMGSARVMWWTRERIDFDPLNLINEADPEKVTDLLKSVFDGEKKNRLNTNHFYALSVSGNGGRVMMRDWLEQKLGDTQNAVARWFEDLSIVDVWEGGRAPYPKLTALLGTLLRPNGKLDELPPQYFSGLIHSAFSQGAIPFGIYAMACKRQQLEEDKLNQRRMVLIKIFLLRSPNNKGVSGMVTTELNKDLKEPAYLCGRIFAVFDRLQYLAQGEVNADVVGRFYASACVTPALVMGRLFRNAQFHLSKLKQSKRGAAWNLEKDFEALTDELKEWPKALGLDGQGLFALGYYHQRAEYARQSLERKNAKEEVQ